MLTACKVCSKINLAVIKKIIKLMQGGRTMNRNCLTSGASLLNQHGFSKTVTRHLYH